MEWSTFWSASSAIATFIAAGIAVWAMFRWRKQEELKAKLNFKLSIANYSYQLIQMPEMLVGPGYRADYQESMKKLNELFAACNNSWHLTEGLLDKNKTVKTAWDFIYTHNSMYMAGYETSEKLGIMTVAIMHEKFIFD